MNIAEKHVASRPESLLHGAVDRTKDALVLVTLIAGAVLLSFYVLDHADGGLRWLTAALVRE